MVISGEYNYSSPQVQEGLERLLVQLENTTYIDPFYTESWLREFLDYVRRNKDYSPIDISTEASFIEALNSVSISIFFALTPGPLISSATVRRIVVVMGGPRAINGIFIINLSRDTLEAEPRGRM